MARQDKSCSFPPLDGERLPFPSLPFCGSQLRTIAIARLTGMGEACFCYRNRMTSRRAGKRSPKGSKRRLFAVRNLKLTETIQMKKARKKIPRQRREMTDTKTVATKDAVTSPGDRSKVVLQFTWTTSACDVNRSTRGIDAVRGAPIRRRRHQLPEMRRRHSLAKHPRGASPQSARRLRLG